MSNSLGRNEDEFLKPKYNTSDKYTCDAIRNEEKRKHDQHKRLFEELERRNCEIK